MGRLTQPPGIRSCKNGGTWEHAKPYLDGKPYIIDSLRKIRARLNMTDADWALLVAELNHLLKRAEVGNLNFDDTQRKGVVCQTGRHPDILEARLSRSLGVGEDHRLLRLYFTEPDLRPEMLLSLNLRDKDEGEGGLTEQDQHIDEAQHRFDQWWTSEVGP
ncbi:hypothetical protein [Schaalia cardiffensis]